MNCTKEVDHDLHKIARALAGGCVDSVAKAVFAHSALRERTKVLDLVNIECAALCRKTGANGPSPFCRLPLKNVEEFSWDIYIQELKLRGPFLLKLFRTLVQHNEHRNNYDKARSKTHTRHMHVNSSFAPGAQPRNDRYPNICVSCSIQPCSKASKFAVHTSYATQYKCMYLLCTQVFTRLNHLNITLLYKDVLQIVSEIGERHLIPLQRWLEAEYVQFIADNVDKRKSVRDVRSDSQAKLHHMYSMIAVKARIPPPTVDRFTLIDLEKIPISTFLPSISDIQSLWRNLVILINRILCKYIKGLACI